MSEREERGGWVGQVDQERQVNQAGQLETENPGHERPETALAKPAAQTPEAEALSPASEQASAQPANRAPEAQSLEPQVGSTERTVPEPEVPSLESASEDPDVDVPQSQSGSQESASEEPPDAENPQPELRSLESLALEPETGSPEPRASAELKAIVEALIFASPDPLTPKALCKLLDSEPKEDVVASLAELKRDYERPCGLQLVEVAGGYQIVTRSDLHEWVRRLFHERSSQKLSVQALETLAVIAYRQPVTAAEITDIRGVNTSGVLNTLLERHLIKIVGRKQVVGRPFMYSTTKEFLIRFGLNDLGDLPKVEDMAEALGIEHPLLIEHTTTEELLPLDEPENELVRETRGAGPDLALDAMADGRRAVSSDDVDDDRPAGDPHADPNEQETMAVPQESPERGSDESPAGTETPAPDPASNEVPNGVSTAALDELTENDPEEPDPLKSSPVSSEADGSTGLKTPAH